MTLIQMQEQHVKNLEPLFRKAHERGYFDGNLRYAKTKENYRHIDEMIAAGYSKREAAESSQQCNEMAALNINFERQFLGVA